MAYRLKRASGPNGPRDIDRCYVLFNAIVFGCCSRALQENLTGKTSNRIIGGTFTERDPILVFDKPDFVVRLHKEWIDVDLKAGGKAKLERVIEKDPLLRKTIGFVLQSIVPSDVELCEIDSVEVDGKGQLKLVIPRHVDIVLPLGVDDANRLAYELRNLIPLAKTKKKADRKRIPLHMWWPTFVGESDIHP